MGHSALDHLQVFCPGEWGWLSDPQGQKTVAVETKLLPAPIPHLTPRGKELGARDWYQPGDSSQLADLGQGPLSSGLSFHHLYGKNVLNQQTD